MSEIDNKIRLDQARRDVAGGKEEVEEARKRTRPFKETKNSLAVAKKAKNMVTAPLKAEPMDIMVYGIAFALAGLKDLLDLVGIGSLPAIGTVITFCVSIAIGFALLFDGISSSQRKVTRRITRKYLVLISGTMVEAFLFGLNFFPFEIITVAIIYWMSLADRKSNV